ncbi:methylosome subunit pICln-like [Tetranychus urticae]|uniref:methylosome subunit pICln-like n=1 Tax=Tetranychus urticae TaxID=32264 RepID=UPI000D65ED88|nr:methylosome subunit pICln-like [Tetranychus urticae]
MAMIIVPKPNTIAPAVNEVRYSEPGVDIYNGVTFLGKGNLFITTSSITWINPENGSGINLSYFDISCHAISRDTTTFGHPCIYMMIRVNELVGSSNEELANYLDQYPEDYEEIRMVPAQEQSLEIIYNMLCECQALNPDPTDNGNHNGASDEDMV